MKKLTPILNGLFYIFVILLVLLAYGTINNNFYRVVVIEGNSMSPTMSFGDLLVMVQPQDDMPDNTIITMSVDGSLVTHRLLGYEVDGFPITKGDANQSTDNFRANHVVIIGKYLMHIPYLGYPLLWMNNLMHKAI